MNDKFRHYNFKSLSNKNKKVILYSFLFVLVIGVFGFVIFLQPKLYTPEIMMVSGTEYISGEQGQVIVRLEDATSKSITDANCWLTLLFPDKSLFLIDVPMVSTSMPGNYYHPFTTPMVNGIYEEYIKCLIPDSEDTTRILNISNSFHVSPGLNLIVQLTTLQKEHYDDLVARLNSLDANVKSQFYLIDNKFYDLQTYLDENVMGEINNLNTNVVDVNDSLNNSINNVNRRLNSTMENNFDEFYNRFKDSYDAMANIFGE
jgi:hypothetical protein